MLNAKIFDFPGKGLFFLFLFATILGEASATDISLCPNLISSLVMVPGNLDAQYTQQRVEIRQCPVDINKSLGVLQLAAWPKDAVTPALVFETEDSGFYQLAMIEGVYVFEMIGGTARTLIAIVFENGIPRIGLEASTLSEPRIVTTPSKIVVEYIDSKDNKQRREEFVSSGKTQRKG